MVGCSGLGYKRWADCLWRAAISAEGLAGNSGNKGLRCDRRGSVLWTQRADVTMRYLAYVVEKYYVYARPNERGDRMLEFFVCLPCFLLDPERPEMVGGGLAVAAGEQFRLLGAIFRGFWERGNVGGEREWFKG